MRILPVIREFTGTWRSDDHERLMLSEDEPGKVQLLWYAVKDGRNVILTGELTVKAAVASGNVYHKYPISPPRSWWQKLLRITPKPRPWGVLTAHFINPQDLWVSYRTAGNQTTIGYRMNAEIRTQIGETDGT